jgi:hypothetical protein
LLALAATTLIGHPTADPAEAGRADRSSIGTWSTAVTGSATPPQPQTVFKNQTLRQIVHVSLGGTGLRVRLSNEYGDQPLVIDEARVARRPARADGSEIAPGTDRRLTFGGRSSITIPAGSPALMPINLVSRLGPLLVRTSRTRSVPPRPGISMSSRTAS